MIGYGYKEKFKEQEEYDYEYFKSAVEFIEDNFKGDVLKYINGRYIFVLLDGMYECSRFINTTVSDLREVCGEINIDCLLHGIENAGNPFLYSLKEPSKKTFMGKIKYTPKGTLCMSFNVIAPDKNGKNVVVGERGIPVLQDEKFLESACMGAFERNKDGTDYDYIEKHAFKFLDSDKRISCHKVDNVGVKRKEAMLMHSKNIQKIISIYFELENSWGACLYHGNNCFIFPMKREYIQKVFKNRDKVDGRRRVIASFVNGYTRKDGTEVDSHLRSTSRFTIDGRTYSIFIGQEDFERAYTNTEKSRNRLKKIVEKSNLYGNIIAYD